MTTPPGGLEAPHHGFAYADGVGWPMRWAPRLTARIRHLHTAGLAEVRWCTSWCVNASQLERLFRLPEPGPEAVDDDLCTAGRSYGLMGAWPMRNGTGPSTCWSPGRGRRG